MAKARIPIIRRSKVSRPGNPDSASERVIAGRTGRKPGRSFFQRKSIEELAAEQGIKPTKLDDILGKGAHLWESDHEFEQFVADIYARRREGREPSKQ